MSYLTPAAGRVYAESVAHIWAKVTPHGLPGIAFPQTERQGAPQKTPFFASTVYGGRCDGVFGRAVPRYGNANVAASTAHSISIAGGGSQPTEAIAMSTSISSAIAPISISSTTIRVVDGLFSLNDLHQASGGEKRHQPSDWLRVQQTQDLIAELAKDHDPGMSVSSAQDDPGIPGTSKDDENTVDFPVIPVAIKTVRGKGKAQGTYACKELVYAYGMWISPRFHLQVIRAFDAMHQAPTVPALPALITVAQQGELATLIAERFPNGKNRPYAWSRFNNHFRLSRYRDLPASRFEEACAYIPAMALPGGAETPALPAPVIDPALTPISDRLAHGRFLATFENNRLHLREIEHDAYVMADHRWPNVIRHEPVTPEVLLDLLDAVAAKLNRRAS